MPYFSRFAQVLQNQRKAFWIFESRMLHHGVASFVSLVTPFLCLFFGRQRSRRAKMRLFLREPTEAIVAAEGSRAARNNASFSAFTLQSCALRGPFLLPQEGSKFFVVELPVRNRVKALRELSIYQFLSALDYMDAIKTL